MIYLVFDETEPKAAMERHQLRGAFSTRLVAEAWIRREHIRQLARGESPDDFKIRAVEINADHA